MGIVFLPSLVKFAGSRAKSKYFPGVAVENILISAKRTLDALVINYAGLWPGRYSPAPAITNRAGLLFMVGLLIAVMAGAAACCRSAITDFEVFYRPGYVRWGVSI